MERAKWLEDNLPDVLDELRLETTEADYWRVAPLLVLDVDLLTPRLVDPPFSIVVADEIAGWLDAGT